MSEIEIKPIPIKDRALLESSAPNLFVSRKKNNSSRLASRQPSTVLESKLEDLPSWQSDTSIEKDAKKPKEETGFSKKQTA